jgi:hypothetical protein
MIEPRKIGDMPPKEVLRLYPSIDLDKFVLDKVLDGPLDFIEETGASLPMFSQRLGACYPIIISLTNNNEELRIQSGLEFFAEAIVNGQMVRKTETVTWKVSDGKYVGYGRVLSEAICKLAICRKFDIVGAYEKRRDQKL